MVTDAILTAYQEWLLQLYKQLDRHYYCSDVNS